MLKYIYRNILEMLFLISVCVFQTPLHLASMNGKVKVVELLLRKDPNAVMDEDEDSNTALHRACMHKRAQVKIFKSPFRSFVGNFGICAS